MAYKNIKDRRANARKNYDPEKARLTRPKGYSNEYYQRKRSKLIEQFGGKCVKCGSTENLEFDHIDRYTKTKKVSTLLASSPWQSAVDEAQKCQLLCNSCHIDKTNQYKDNRPIL